MQQLGKTPLALQACIYSIMLKHSSTEHNILAENPSLMGLKPLLHKGAFSQKKELFRKSL